jgi:hypothetical protein
MSYIILRGRWCNIVVLNVHTPCEDKGDGVKDSFYEELGHVFDQFPRYDISIFLDDFNAKVGGEKSSNRQSEKRVSMKLVMTMELRVVNFATSKNLVVKSTMFQIAKFINTLGPLLTETHATRVVTF